MITAIVPMKPLAAAKKRLSGVLPDVTRRQLAIVMLCDVLDCLAASPEINEVCVVSEDDAVAALAARHGARHICESSHCGLDAAVTLAAATLAAGTLAFEGIPAMLYVPGDVPLVTACEISVIAGAARRASVVVVPSHDREGTNALLMSPPGALVPSFGPGSFNRHMQAAEKAGLDAAALELTGLSRDIDTVEDLAQLAAARSGDSRYAFLVSCLNSASMVGEAV